MPDRTDERGRRGRPRTRGTRADSEFPVSEAADRLGQSVQRGGAASEAARDTVDTAIDVAVQGRAATRAARAAGLGGDRARRDRVAISGPATNLPGPNSSEVFESGRAGDVNREVAETLASGEGVLSDEQRADLREDINARQRGLDFSDQAADIAADLGGGETAQTVAEVAGRTPAAGATATAQITLAADSAAAAARKVPEAVREAGAAETTETVANVAGGATVSVIKSAEQNPVRFSATVARDVALGTAAGKAAGSGGRFVSDRVRTAGAEELELEDTTPEGVVENVKTGGDRGDRFPRATDPDQFRRDQKTSIEADAEEFTPDELAERFEDEGVTGTDLFKTLDAEPEGPGQGRAAQGFSSPEADAELSQEFETSGTSFGPAVSRYFLRVGGGETSFSLKPGLPDFGNRPTAVATRLEVKRTDAGDVQELDQELRRRAGEAEARTLSPDEATPRESEVLLPPGTDLSDIGGSRRRQALRKLGVGSDFFLRIPNRATVQLPGGRTVKSPLGAEVDLPGGRSFTIPGGSRRVPVRPVVPDDAPKRTGADADAPDGDAGDANANRAFEGKSSSAVVRRPERNVDRPLPTVGLGGSAGASGSGGSSGSTPTLSPTRPTDPTTPSDRPSGASSGGPGASGGDSSSGPSGSAGGSGGSSPPGSGSPSGGPSSPGGPPSSSPSGSAGGSGGSSPPGSGTVAPPGAPSGPTKPFEVPDGSRQSRDVGAKLGADFEKTFEAEVATAETVAFGDLDALADEAAFTAPGGRFRDTDTTPEIVEVTGDPTDEERRELVGGSEGDQ
jgi:hypothetical protein